MEPRINVITLAVDDLERAVQFYRDGLGLPTQGIVGTEFVGVEDDPAGDVAMFTLNDNLILSLYPRTELAKDARQTIDKPSSTEFSLGYTVGSKAEVEDLLERAAKAGADVTENPHARPWGIYSGYFKDLDGHLWEIVAGDNDEPADTPEA